MKPLTIVTPYSQKPFFEKILLSLKKSAMVERIVIVSQEPVQFKMAGCRLLLGGPIYSRETLSQILGEIQTKYLLLLPEAQEISLEPESPGEIPGDG